MKPNNCNYKDRITRYFVLFPIFLLCFLSLSPYCQSQQPPPKSDFTNDHPAPNFLMLNEVNRNASRHFMDHFLDDASEKWFMENNNFVASFTESGIRNKAYYKSNGDFVLVVKSYGDESLNNDLKNAILDRFSGYKINSIIEITDLEKEIYIVKILNRENILTITCTDGKLEVTGKILNGGI